MLLLLDFLRLAASELPTSTVAFSLSMAFRMSVCAPIDLRVRRVAGMVASVGGDMLDDSRGRRRGQAKSMGVASLHGGARDNVRACLFTLAGRYGIAQYVPPLGASASTRLARASRHSTYHHVSSR